MTVTTKGKKYYEYALIVMAAIGLVTMGLMFTYMDVTSIQGWAFEFWDCIFSGRITRLHTVIGENWRQVPHVSCGGNFLWLFPIAVWNLPLWVLNEICFHFVELPQWMTVWTKFLYVAAVILMAKEITRIVDAEKQEKNEIILFCVGSFEIILSTMYAGQDEILYLSIFMIAMRCYREQKYKRFLVLGILAATMCPIMLIPLLVLVLDIRKIWLSIIILFATGIIGTIYQFIVKNDEWFWQYHASALVMIDDMVGQNTYGAPLGDIAPFYLVIILICYVSLFVPTFDLDRQKDKIQLACISMLAISFLTTQVFYRWLLYVPFAIILIYLRGNAHIQGVVFCIISYTRAYWILRQTYIMDSSFESRLLNKEKGVWLYAELINRIESLKYAEKMVIPTMYAMVVVFLYNCFKMNLIWEKDCRELKILSFIAKTVYALIPIGVLIVFWNVS